jgi:uncharacterized alpha-E superfamily protein
VLNRLAASVFRVGAAVERTDLVARLLDVHLGRFGDGATQGERVVCRELRAIVGAQPVPDAELDRATTLDALAVDRHDEASIAHAVAVARDDARRAREVVSTELWECLNTTRSRMPRKIAVDRAHDFLGWVRERSALAVGVVESDASRDEVWDFFTLGRSLERLGVTARMLGSDLVDPGSAASWTLALRSCGAAEAFQREHHHAVRAPDAAAFLLLDELSPRSVRFVADRVADCLGGVAPELLRAGDAEFVAARASLVDLPAADAVEATRGVAERFASAAASLGDALDARDFAADPTC